MDGRARLRLVRAGVERQVHAEGVAALFGRYLDAATVGLGGALDQREAETPAALARGVSPAGERLEDGAALLLVERRAHVVHRDGHAARLFVDRDGDRRILDA